MIVQILLSLTILVLFGGLGSFAIYEGGYQDRIPAAYILGTVLILFGLTFIAVLWT